MLKISRYYNYKFSCCCFNLWISGNFFFDFFLTFFDCILELKPINFIFIIFSPYIVGCRRDSTYSIGHSTKLCVFSCTCQPIKCCSTCSNWGNHLILNLILKLLPSIKFPHSVFISLYFSFWNECKLNTFLRGKYNLSFDVSFIEFEK